MSHSSTFPEPLHALRQQVIEQASAHLGRVGRVIQETGVYRRTKFLVCCHSDFGPADQDKLSNEDFVLAWLPAEEVSGVADWAIAMADGVSSSYFAREAAELACWTALSQLVKSPGGIDPLAVGTTALSKAAKTLESLGNLVRTKPEQCRPYEEYASTWDYVVRRGRFLQTTLTLAWSCDGRLFVVAVGDGGGMLQVGDDGAVQEIMTKPIESHLVHCLGPDNAIDERADVAWETNAPEAFRLALFTDGLLGFGLTRPDWLLDRNISARIHNRDNNPAKAIVGDWLLTDPQYFDDNVTLALVVQDDHPELDEK